MGFAIIYLVEQVISDLVKQLFDVETTVVLTRPEPQFGDLATNIALQLAGKLQRKPREIAEQIAVKLRENEDFTGVEVAGPGFINIFLSDAALLSLAHKNPSRDRDGKNVVIETNNPNPFKAMHIGHAMNAIVADTVANLLALDGAGVARVSYHGDVGLHVGKSMYSILKYINHDIKNLEKISADERNGFMSRMYADGSKAYKNSPEAKEEIDRLAAESFAPNDGLFREVYEMCLEWSWRQIESTVARLGNQPTVARFLESLADTRGTMIVKDHTPGVFEMSDGAHIFRGSEHGSFDNVFIASNGRGLYAARDLGLMQLKNDLFHPDQSYIVTGSEQGAYFRGVIAAAELCDPSLKGQTYNIPTGLVKLTTGKMSSRNGDIVEISWLFDQFAEAIRARGGEPDDVIIAGALRYQFLKVKIGGDIIFDIADAVSLTGNTGSYLQYAYVRATHILAKASEKPQILEEIATEDRALVRKLSEFSEIIDLAKAKLEPHHICNYLFDLAQEFNRYYEKNQVVGNEHEAHRVSLVAMYADTLKAGLSALGITAPDKM